MNSADFRMEARNKLAGKWGKVALITLVMVLITGTLSFLINAFKEPNPNYRNTYNFRATPNISLDYTIGRSGLSFNSSQTQTQDTTLSLILSIISLIIGVPLTYGTIMALFKVYNGEDVSAFDGVKLAISNFSRAWGVAFRKFLKLILPLVAVFLSMFLLGFSVGFGVVSGNSVIAFLGLISVVLLIASYVWIFVRSLSYALAELISIDEQNLTALEAVNKSKELMAEKRAKYVLLILSFIGWIILAAFTLGIGMLWLTPYIECALIAFYEFTKGEASN